MSMESVRVFLVAKICNNAVWKEKKDEPKRSNSPTGNETRCTGMDVAEAAE